MASSTFRKRAADFGFAIAISAALIHFGHRAVQGESGFFARLAAQKEERRLTEDLAALAAERDRLENLTRRLSVDYLDLDLLDERARDVLGYVRADEVVIR